MLEWLKIALLAVIQGSTEFLPVSSSGHLLIFGNLLGLDSATALAVGIYLHFGSLLAILLFYSKMLFDLVKQRKFRLFLLLIAATIPAGAAGILLRITGMDKWLLSAPFSVAMAFLVTGMLLKMTDKKKLVPPPEQAVELENISWSQALIIGLVQMIALLPGISRSGSTISTALFCGVKREAAAAFSFLMALPVIAGATLVEWFSPANNMKLPAGMILFAATLSFATSLAALSQMTKWVKNGKLSRFSWYMFTLGTAVLIWQILIYNGA